MTIELMNIWCNAVCLCASSHLSLCSATARKCGERSKPLRLAASGKASAIARVLIPEEQPMSKMS